MEDLKNKNVIYKITSPTGRVYIGQSTEVERRFTMYRRLDCKNQNRLYNSLKKHRWENHIFEIIEECEFEQLNIRERYWQDFYDVLNGGLNCILTETDILPRKVSEETKVKMSEAQKGEKSHMFGKKGELSPSFGRVVSEESKQKQKESVLIYYETNEYYWKGRTHTDESKEKMSLSRIGKTLTEEHKSKIGRKGELNANFGKVMPEEQKEKLRLLNTGKKYPKERGEKMREINGTKVINTQTKEIFDSINQASKTIGISDSTLGDIFLGKRENTTNLLLLSEYDENIKYENKVENPNLLFKKVQNIETGEIFKSISQARKTTDILQTYFRNMLIGKSENTTSFRLI